MEKVGSPEKPEVTTFMLLKVAALGISMAAGFRAIFLDLLHLFRGHDAELQELVPFTFLELTCTTCFVLMSRYLRGQLFVEGQLRSIVRSLWLGRVLLVLSIAFGLLIIVFSMLEDIRYLFADLIPSILAVFWSAVLVKDAKHYRKIFNHRTSVEIFSILEPFDIQNTKDFPKPIKN